VKRTVIAAGATLLAREVVKRRMRYDVQGKVALVTGGSRGLGFAIAAELAARGARVVICARDEERLERARSLLAARCADVRALRCDVGDKAQVDELIAQTGRVDILVNNAGVIAVGPLETQRVEDFEQLHAAMFWGVVYPTLAVLPQMTEHGEGRIVNVTSIGGKVSVPFLLPYCAAKFGAVGFSQGLRTELAGKRILVTTVVPGLMRTGSYRAALFKGRRTTMYNLFASLSTLPLTTISAPRAARKIVRALERGDPELILTAHANVMVRLNGIAPATMQRALGIVARALPHGGGVEPVPGRNLGSPVDRSVLTALGRKAAADLNQR